MFSCVSSPFCLLIITILIGLLCVQCSYNCTYSSRKEAKHTRTYSSADPTLWFFRNYGLFWLLYLLWKRFWCFANRNLGTLVISSVVYIILEVRFYRIKLYPSVVYRLCVRWRTIFCFIVFLNVI